ncbi:protein kinase family protein [Flindersiella endophytica]
MNYNTRRLFDAIQTIHRDGEDTGLDEAVAGWSVYDWRDVLLDLPIDSSTFASQLEISWDVSISTLAGWTRRFAAPRDERVLGYTGVLLITLLSLRYSELRRAPWGEARREDGHNDCADSCQRLVENPAVQAALSELYAPRMTDADSAAVVREWESIDFGTLRFHRHGTTSFIVTGRLTTATHGRLPTFALKLIIYPFLRIPTIARATRGYAAEFDPPAGEPEHLVGVWASSGSWILMDFVPGQTLAERIEAEFATGRRAGRGDATSAIRLDLIEQLGRELFRALAELERLGKQHGDLTPSNIMVTETPDGQLKVHLIDLGVNYLYLRNMPGHGGVDAPYVAPEIRDIDDQAETGFARSDLYSLGQLIVLLGSGAPAPDGHVPTAFYAQAPPIARFIEDLIDADPRRRLLLFHARHAPDGLPYDRLWTNLVDELAAARTSVSDRRWWSDIAALADPFFGTVWRLGRLWRERRKQGPDRERAPGRLFAWSVASAVFATLTSVLISIWIRRIVGWDWDNDVIVALQRLFGAQPDEFPLIDQLKSPHYKFPVGAPKVAFGVLALTFTLIGVKYYQSLFASVTPMALGRGAGRLGVRALVAEIAMRFWTIAPVLMVLPPLLVQPLWWAVFAAAGMTIVTICNWLAASFGQAVVKEGRKLELSTVPERITGISRYRSWIPGNTLYAVLLWMIAILLQLGVARDAIVYVSMICLVNVVQLYVVKCSVEGPDIRAGLGRACIAAERIRHLRLAEAAEPVIIPPRRAGADPLRSHDESAAAPDRS